MPTITLDIAGVERTDYLKASSGTISRDINGRARFTGVFEELERGYTPARGNILTIYEDNGSPPGPVKRFSGNISRIVKRFHPGSEALTYDVEARDFSAILDHRLVTLDIAAGRTLYEIVTLVFNQALAAENITIANVANPGATITEPLKFYYESATSVFNKLSTLTGYLWYIDFDKDLHFSQFTSNAAPFDLTDTSQNWLHRTPEDFEVEFSDEDYRNRQHERTEGGISRTITESIDLDNFAPVTQAAIKEVFYITINAVNKTFVLLDSTAAGFQNPTSGVDFWVNINDYGIFPVDYTIQAGDVLEIQYRGIYSQSVVTVNDYAEQTSRAAAEDGSGIWESIEEQKNINAPGQLGNLALGRLRQFGSDEARIRFNTAETGLEPAQRINIQNTILGINAEYLIERVDYQWQAMGSSPEEFFWHTVYCTSNEPFGRPQGFVEKLVEMARIGPPEGEASDVTEGDAGDEEYFIWHVRGTLVTGKNNTNHHDLKRDCLAFEVLASTADGPPSSTMKANFTYTDPDTATQISLLYGDGVTIAAGQKRSGVVTFPSPAVAMLKRGFVELNVTDGGGASNVQFTMRAR